MLARRRVLLRTLTIAALTSGLLAGPGLISAAPTVAEPTMALTEGIPPWELAVVGGVLALDVALVGAGWLWADQIDPAIGSPGADSLDRRASESMASGRHDPLLWGAPDAGGWVLSLLPVALYGSSSVLLGTRGVGWMGAGDNNPHLRLAAYAEALSLTLLLAQGAKLTVGRTRPRAILYDDPAEPGDSEAHLSFFSMHTALSFTAASFLALDLAARLDRGPGLALGALLYAAAALVGFSRIHDQAHFLSDVLVGAAVGLLSGNLTYLRHFHTDGRSRRAPPGAQTTEVGLTHAGALRGAALPPLGIGCTF